VSKWIEGSDESGNVTVIAIVNVIAAVIRMIRTCHSM